MDEPSGEIAPEKHRGLKEPWKPGQSGNPKGRPKGSRNKLAEQFFVDFLQAWEERGAEALAKVAQTDPATFVRVASTLMPREMKIEHAAADLTDEQLEQRARDIAARLGLAFRVVAGVGGTADGAEAQETAH